MTGRDKLNKRRGVSGEHHPPQPPPPQYGTFQPYPLWEPQPPSGFPQPVPTPGSVGPPPPPPPPPQYYAHGYQAVPGYAVAEGIPVTVRERRLRCCGLGCGWCLFILGFFLAAIPWYAGAVILSCSAVDHREKPGFIACTIAAIIATIAVIIGVTKGSHVW